MAGIKKNNKNRKSLIAENRFKKHSKKSQKKLPTKNSSKPIRRSATKFLIQFIQRISRFFLQLIWGFIWRSSLIVITGISLAVSYYYLDMKEFDSLLDERSRGSVTLENNTGEVFAWRGDNFSKNLTANNISTHLKNAVLATEDRKFYWYNSHCLSRVKPHDWAQVPPILAP